MLHAKEKRQSRHLRAALARKRARQERATHFAGPLALTSLIAGLLSTGADIMLLSQIFLPRNILPRLITPYPNLLAFTTAGIWLGLAPLAVICALIVIISAPAGGIYRKVKVQAYVGLSLGTLNLLVIYGYIRLFIILAASLPVGPDDQIGVWLVAR